MTHVAESAQAGALLSAPPACMGGMCWHRNHCRRHVTEQRDFVVERLCARGHEAPTPVEMPWRVTPESIWRKSA